MLRYQSDAIQYLRAFAALAVVAYHAIDQNRLFSDAYDSYRWLQGGVDIFFVISGYVMFVSTTANPQGVVGFFKARLIRIVPLYWLVTSVLVVAMLAFPSMLRTSRFDLDHVIASYAFVAWPHPSVGLTLPVLIPGWTLNYEMAFYLGFGLLLPLRLSLRLPSLIAVGCGLTLVHLLPGERGAILSFYTDPIILEFVAGSCIGYGLQRRRAMSGPVALGLMVIGFGAMVVLNTAWGEALPRVLMNGIPAVMIVWGAVSAENAYRPGPSAMGRRLGDASYSIYLAHPVVLAAAGVAWTRFGVVQPIAQVPFVAAAILSASAAGLLLHAGVERPLLGLMRTLTAGRHVSRRTSAQPLQGGSVVQGV